MDASRLVRCGPRRMLRPPLPYVYWRGVAHAPPAVLNDVSNQCVIIGFESAPDARRFGRLPPALDTDVASTGVNGSPLCQVKIPLTCQPPKIAFANEFESPTRRPFPNGRS